MEKRYRNIGWHFKYTTETKTTILLHKKVGCANSLCESMMSVCGCETFLIYYSVITTTSTMT